MHLPPFLVDSDVGLALLIVTGADNNSSGVLPDRHHLALQRQRAQRSHRGPLSQRVHSAYNSATSLGEQKFTGELISGFALLNAVGALVVLAVLLVVFTRGRLAYEPERAGSRATERENSSPTEGALTTA